MTLIRRANPGYPARGFGWGHFNSLQNEMNQLFENFLGRGYLTPVRSVFPPVNIYEDGQNLYLTAELPGMEAKHIEIHAEADSIQLKGERKIESEGEKVCYHRRERESGSFNKKITLQTRIATDKVTAVVNDGILKITLPKAEEAKPRKVEIKVD